MSQETEPVPVPPVPQGSPAAGPDLEKLRDEKCIPVARMVLNDMAVGLMSPSKEKNTETQQQIVMKILQRTLDADLNLSMDNPYIFQLLAGVFSGLTTTVVECTTVPIDDLRYSTISKKILDIVATADIKMGTLTPEETVVVFAPVKERLNVLFAEEKLSWLEVKFIMDSIFNAFKGAKERFDQSLDMAVQRMEAKILGVEDMTDLTMSKLDTVLKTPMPAAEEQKS